MIYQKSPNYHSYLMTWASAEVFVGEQTFLIVGTWHDDKRGYWKLELTLFFLLYKWVETFINLNNYFNIDNNKFSNIKTVPLGFLSSSIKEFQNSWPNTAKLWGPIRTERVRGTVKSPRGADRWQQLYWFKIGRCKHAGQIWQIQTVQTLVDQ